MRLGRKCKVFTGELFDNFNNRTALTQAYRGQLWKGHQKNIIMTDIMSINRFYIVWNSLLCSKIYYLYNETKVLVVNWLKWHYKLQHLFCGALYYIENAKNVLFHLFKILKFIKIFNAEIGFNDNYFFSIFSKTLKVLWIVLPNLPAL